MGKLILFSICLGRSATRSNSHVFPFIRNTPGLSKQAISIPPILAGKSPGRNKGFWMHLLAISIVKLFLRLMKLRAAEQRGIF
jgi:hypothetical protein